MAGGKSQAKSQRVDHGGHYRMIPMALLESVAWRGLSMRAKCIALVLLSRFNGFNNGGIAASARDIADAVGSRRYAANRAALGELIESGIVTVERIHPRGSRMATEYRLTFVETGNERHRHPATNEWRLVRSGNRRENSGHETSTRNGERVDAPSTEREHRVDAPSTDATGTSHFLPTPPVDALSTLIVSHAQGVSGSGEILPFKSPEMLAGRNPASTCVMDLAELREFAKGYLSRAEPGAQSKLAAASGVPGSSLSKFLDGKGLAVDHRLKLQLAVARAWPVEQRSA